MFYLCAKFEVSCCTHSKFTKGAQNVASGPNHPPFGGNLSFLGWDILFYLCAKFEVLAAACTHSKIYKFGPWTPSRPLWRLLSSLRVRWDMSWSICVPNLNFYMDPFQIYERGPKIYKFGQLDPTTPHPCHGID